MLNLPRILGRAPIDVDREPMLIVLLPFGLLIDRALLVPALDTYSPWTNVSPLLLVDLDGVLLGEDARLLVGDGMLDIAQLLPIDVIEHEIVYFPYDRKRQTYIAESWIPPWSYLRCDYFPSPQ